MTQALFHHLAVPRNTARHCRVPVMDLVSLTAAVDKAYRYVICPKCVGLSLYC